MNGSFDWRQLGRADYSQAAALVASLPEEIRCQLDNTDKELVVRIVHLSWRFAEKAGRNVGYCWPALKTLASYCGRCVRTVERHLRKLASLGLIEWRRRATQDGQQTSNLYQAGKRFLATLFARRARKSPTIRPTTKMSHNDLKREYKAGADSERPARLTDFLNKLRANRPPLADSQADGSAESGWGEENYETRRRRELKFEPRPRLGPDNEEW